MIDPDGLNVWAEQHLVGCLWRNPVGYIGFRYDPEWIAAGGFAISRTLPLGIDDFAAEDGIAIYPPMKPSPRCWPDPSACRWWTSSCGQSSKSIMR